MSSSYPAGLDSFTTKVNGVDVPDASHVNDLQDAVEAIETELGVNPAGIEATVSARIAALEAGGSDPGGTGPAGFLMKGMLAISVSSYNMTVAIKTLAGADPSAGDPVTVRIGNVDHTIESALSVTKNAGTNWFGAAATEFVSKEIDYFVYLGYNATDGVVIGFSRIPWGRVYADFSTTSTNEKYAAISTIAHADAEDDYEVIGRFSAILGASATYRWSLPAAPIIINRPIFETRELDYQPVYSASGSMTWSTITTVLAKYKLGVNQMWVTIIAGGTTAGTASNSLIATLPFSAAQAANNPASPANVADGGNTITGLGVVFDTTPDTIQARKYDASNYGLGGSRYMRVNCRLEV